MILFFSFKANSIAWLYTLHRFSEGQRMYSIDTAVFVVISVLLCAESLSVSYTL